MEAEKRVSKGGFLHLFDWNAKSRKKLFSNKSELPEGSKQGKENFDCSGLSQLQQMKVHENGLCPSVKESTSDYSCDLSVSGDEGHGTKAPGVVARLMGLDSLPTSNVSEPSFTPFPESNSFRDFHSQRITTNFQSKHQSINYVSVRDKLERLSRNPVEVGLQKVQNRPIERFQSEILPSKSTKLIPITHHKLLSPIKNLGIPRKNAAYIMEAAAKIIEQSPQSTTKHKMASFGSSSVPLRIRDLKQKIEAAQEVSRLPEASRRPREPGSVKYTNEKRRDRSRSRTENSQLFKASIDSGKSSSDSSKNKGKSVSLAIQAKVNVQRREESTVTGNRSSMDLKDNNEVQSDHCDKNQQNAQRSSQKRTLTRRTSDVLRQNNQKQNGVSDKDKVNSKPSVSNPQDRKSLSMNGSLRPSKTSNKVVTNSVTANRKSKSVATDTGKEHLSYKTKNLSQKKQPVSGDFHTDEHIGDNQLINKNERSIKCNIAVDGCMNWDAVDRKNSMDVVSFTFTSPIKKSMPGSQLSSQVIENNDSICIDPNNDQPQLKHSTLSSPGFNVIGGDALSELLEQKLKELTCIVESSHSTLVNTAAASCSTSSLQESMSTLKVFNTIPEEHDKRFQLGLQQDKSDGLYNFKCSLVDGLLFKDKQKWQGSEEVEEHTSNNGEYENEHVCPYPTLVSSLEPSFSDVVSSLELSFSDESCNSSDGKTSISSRGSKHCLSAEAQGKSNCISAKVPELVEGETELSDSASSISTGCMDRKDRTTTFCYVDFKQLSDWELEYIRDILCNAELTLEGFSLCHPHEVINPDMFDQLENQRTGSHKIMEKSSKLGRKVLFDCVSECMGLRCERLSGGSCKEWTRWATLFRRKGWLADELYKEISSWASMGDLMVDELVDKDMSTQYGKWVDFETEAFEEGVQIEQGILTSLVDELVTDIFFF
ncbi:uncharacterized protein LOC132299614 [Cornus florida]|uniref:uncharacterized protein LOC132299614 n=1 Tax=Cornus florida TaxID=4283 RepID=UPI00289CCFAE|nr:uncharacterized protein LOC132299614 [Cornus florida]